MAEETEQMIWYSDVWSRRFVVWIAGMNPTGAEPSEWAVFYKCDQQLRAQLGARFADSEQQRRFARLVSLVKRRMNWTMVKTCLHRSDPGVTSDVVKSVRRNRTIDLSQLRVESQIRRLDCRYESCRCGAQ